MLLSSFSIKFGLRSFSYFKNVFMNMAVSGLETKTAIFILSLRHFKNVCRRILSQMIYYFIRLL